MTCAEKLYVARAFDIPLSIAADSGFVVGDIVALSVTLTLTTNPTITKNYTIAGGGVTVVGSVITLLVLAADITTPGWYSVKIDLTDNGGKVRGITPCPERLRWWS